VSWQAIARKDLRDSIRSRTLRVLIALFFLLLGGMAYVARTLTDTSFDEFVDLTAEAFALVVPLFAVVVGYKSIIDERESGTIALALSFPHARWEFVAGKFLGRGAVLTIPILASMIAVTALVSFLFETLPVLSYLLLVVASVLYGLAFLALTLGLSMALSTGRRVTTAAFGAYIILVLLWTDLVDLLVLVLWRFDGTILTDPPGWAQFLGMASPSESYARLVTALFDSDIGAVYVGSDRPWLLEPWLAVLVLLGWIALSIGIGYDRFRRVEL
jgi:ABC-2 type transport system permease protein